MKTTEKAPVSASFLERIVSCFFMSKNDWIEIGWYTIWGMVLCAVLGIEFVGIGFMRWMIGWLIIVLVLPKKPWIHS